MKLVPTVLCLLGIGLISSPCVNGASASHSKENKQTWGYVEVRPGAHMFWWLYYASQVPDYTKVPLIIWLQGGPGASSTGFGNFEEIGPLDHNLKNRTHTWVKDVNVLFIDNPVGCGFSYVNDTKLLVTNNTQIASDLVEMLTGFLDKVTEFQEIPLYIFSESYGGKMAAQFALKLWKKIEIGKMKCNLKGVSLGDSWISPIDSVLTWAPFLFSTSLVDTAGFDAINSSAFEVKYALDKGLYKKATALWDQTEGVIEKYTNGVNLYNILEPSENVGTRGIEVERQKNVRIPSIGGILAKVFPFPVLKKDEDDEEATPMTEDNRRPLAAKYLKPFHSDPLTDLMNGPVKKMLRIVPDNVTWGGQSHLVFDALTQDFMKPVVRVVENLLNNTPVAVNVYSGQLDLIVDTMGTLKWVEEMIWSGIPGWMKSPRKPVMINNSTEMFSKVYKNLGFYWVLKAGHMVPADAPETALKMMRLMTRLD